MGCLEEAGVWLALQEEHQQAERRSKGTLGEGTAQAKASQQQKRVCGWLWHFLRMLDPIITNLMVQNNRYFSSYCSGGQRYEISTTAPKSRCQEGHASFRGSNGKFFLTFSFRCLLFPGWWPHLPRGCLHLLRPSPPPLLCQVSLCLPLTSTPRISYWMPYMVIFTSPRDWDLTVSGDGV